MKKENILKKCEQIKKRLQDEIYSLDRDLNALEDQKEDIEQSIENKYKAISTYDIDTFKKLSGENAMEILKRIIGYDTALNPDMNFIYSNGKKLASTNGNIAVFTDYELEPGKYNIDLTPVHKDSNFLKTIFGVMPDYDMFDMSNPIDLLDDDNVDVDMDNTSLSLNIKSPDDISIFYYRHWLLTSGVKNCVVFPLDLSYIQTRSLIRPGILIAQDGSRVEFAVAVSYQEGNK